MANALQQLMQKLTTLRFGKQQGKRPAKSSLPLDGRGGAQASNGGATFRVSNVSPPPGVALPS